MTAEEKLHTILIWCDEALGSMESRAGLLEIFESIVELINEPTDEAEKDS